MESYYVVVFFWKFLVMFCFCFRSYLIFLDSYLLFCKLMVVVYEQDNFFFVFLSFLFYFLILLCDMKCWIKMEVMLVEYTQYLFSFVIFLCSCLLFFALCLCILNWCNDDGFVFMLCCCVFVSEMKWLYWLICCGIYIIRIRIDFFVFFDGWSFYVFVFFLIFLSIICDMAKNGHGIDKIQMQILKMKKYEIL